MQAALVHGRKQADGFEGYGLAAGVGAGYHKGVKAVAQLQVDGDGPGLVQQRVPCPAEDHGLFVKGGLLAVELVGELGLGKDQIQAGENVVVGGNIVPVLGAVGGELGQDPVNFQFLPGGQLPQLVVGFHGGHGLYEKGHARGGDIVHQAGHRPLVVGLHGDHIAVRAHGDDRFLKRLGIGGGGNDPLQRLPGSGGGGPHLPADVRKRGGGGVGNFILSRNGAVYFFFQKFIGPQGGEKMVNAGPAHAVIGQISPHQPGALQNGGNVHQLPGVQAPAQVRPGQRRAHILHPGKRGAAPDDHHGFGGGRLRKAAAYLRRVPRGAQRRRPFPGAVPHRLGRQQLQHGGQLQGHKRFFKKTHIRLTFILLFSNNPRLKISAPHGPADSAPQRPPGAPPPPLPPGRRTAALPGRK